MTIFPLGSVSLSPTRILHDMPRHIGALLADLRKFVAKQGSFVMTCALSRHRPSRTSGRYACPRPV